jgi:hypothetical protein
MERWRRARSVPAMRRQTLRGGGNPETSRTLRGNLKLGHAGMLAFHGDAHRTERSLGAYFRRSAQMARRRSRDCRVPAGSIKGQREGRRRGNIWRWRKAFAFAVILRRGEVRRYRPPRGARPPRVSRPRASGSDRPRTNERHSHSN